MKMVTSYSMVFAYCKRILPLIILTVYTGLLLISSRLQFPTRNEGAHVPAGLYYWHNGTFGLYNVNPPLWKMLATIPTILFDPILDGLKTPALPGERIEF